VHSTVIGSHLRLPHGTKQKINKEVN